MNRFIHLVIASIVLLHALLGCCAHHPHCWNVADESISETSGCPCGHDGRSRPPSKPVDQDNQSSPHQCEDLRCNLMVVTTPPFAIDVLVSWIDSDSLLYDQRSFRLDSGARQNHDRLCAATRLQTKLCRWLI